MSWIKYERGGKVMGSGKDVAALMLLLEVWHQGSMAMWKLLDRVMSPQQKLKGQGELSKLIESNSDGLATLKPAMKEYRYEQDLLDGQFDWLQPPWYTALRKAGDCEDLAALVQKARGGQLFDVLKMKDGKFKKGHIMLWDRTGYVWSNGRVYETPTVWDDKVMLLKRIARQYMRDYTHIVLLTTRCKYTKIITR